jgi:RNA methyltransferase, TrmH family
VKHITSRDNLQFKEWKKLAGSARQRGKVNQTLLDGAHLIDSFLACGGLPQQLLVTAQGLQDGEVANLLRRMDNVPLTLLEDSLFGELTELKSPSGLLALIATLAPAMSVAESRFCLLLEDIQDPGNLGSIIRSAAAAGCDAVFLSQGCADAWSPRVLRAGMGGHFARRPGSGLAMSIHETADLSEVVSEFPGQIFAASLNAEKSLYRCDLHGAIGFAIGNEGAGLSNKLLSVTHPFTIPMPGSVESLNAAAAAAVCLFEAARQRS